MTAHDAKIATIIGEEFRYDQIDFDGSENGL